MLQTSARLNLSQNFKWVRSGRSLENNLIKIFYRFSETSHPPKIGIALTSASFKTAVARNRARRLISTCVESYYSKLPESLNLIVMPKTEVLNYSSTNLQVPIFDLLGKIS